MTAYWIATMICIAGTVVNVWRCNACFFLWFVGEVIWTGIDAGTGVYPRVLLDLLGAALALLGIWRNVIRRNRA